MEATQSLTAHDIADVVTPKVNNDFLEDNKVNLGSSLEASATHSFRISRDFVVIDDGQTLGTQLMNVRIDPTIDPAAQELAKAYEYYDFSEIIVSLEATSPFGTASGSFQTAWITDPANTDLGQADAAAKAAALNKVIRQEGSTQVRPRTSAELSAKPNGKRYCLSNSKTDPRLTSFGAIVAVLRDPPSTGDTASFAVTISGKINFYRATIALGVTNASLKSEIKEFRNFAGLVRNGVFGLSYDLYTKDENVRFNQGKILFNKPAEAVIVAKAGDFTRRGITRWQIADARALGERNGSAVYKCWNAVTELGNIESINSVSLTEEPVLFTASYLGVE